MRTVTLEGYLVADSPIHQGSDEHTGNTKSFARSRIIQPDAGTKEVPRVSGNSIRGIFRRLLMDDVYGILGREPKNVKTKYTLNGGGSLTSVDTGDSGVMNLATRKNIRKIVPLALLGTAVGNQMPEGKMKDTFALPICAETIDRLPDHVRGVFPEHEKLSVSEYLDNEFITRRDDYRDERLEEEAATAKPEKKGEKPGDDKDKEKARPQQMLANFEVLAAGTPFYLRFDLEDPTDIEVSCLARALELWKQRPWFGGMSAKGMGRVRIMLPDTAKSLTTETVDGKVVDRVEDVKLDSRLYLDGADWAEMQRVIDELDAAL